MSDIKPTRACFTDPTDPKHQAYFIRNYQYARVHYTSAPISDQLIEGPASLDHWPALANAGVVSIDGVLPWSDDPHKAYLFSGGLFFTIQFDDNGGLNVIGEAQSIHAHWLTLNKSEFTTIDAVMPVPGHKNQAYFFKGTRYVRIEYVPGGVEGRVVFGPTEIHNEWIALKNANFSTIDCILPHPLEHDHAYFFSGNNYCGIKMKPGSRDNHIFSGPHTIGEHYWPSLHEAKFY